MVNILTTNYYIAIAVGKRIAEKQRFFTLVEPRGFEPLTSALPELRINGLCFLWNIC